MGKSTFNMSRCGSGGGLGGNSQPCSGWTQITPTGGDEITVVSDDKLKNMLRQIWLEDDRSHTNNVSDDVILKYDCPKEGDAVFWNQAKSGYDLASAEHDAGNVLDTEHLIESLGIVEKVYTSNCTDSSTSIGDEETLARIVFFGKITFSNQTTPLKEGTVYYLSDRKTLGFIDREFILGNNAVHANYEPAISKPLFVATGTHTAIVTNYRPLTGSPTGGTTVSEEYRMTVVPREYTDLDGNFVYTGWRINVENIGSTSSRNEMFLQIEYNKLEGPQSNEQNFHMIGDETYVSFKHIGVLYNSAEAAVSDSDNISSSKTIDFIPGTTGSSDDALNTTPFTSVTGMGEITVRLKVNTQSTSNITFADRIASPEIYLTNSGDVTKSRIVPTLGFTAGCVNDPSNSNDLFINDSQEVASFDHEEGVVFKIQLQDSVSNSVGLSNPVTMKVPMASDIGFMIEALVQSNTGYVVDPSWSAIKGSFKLLPGGTEEVIEIIPVNSSGDAVVEKQLRIRAINKFGEELPPTHWASVYANAQTSTSCDSLSCCIDTLERLYPAVEENSFAKPITSILTDGDCEIFNNVGGATFYSKRYGGSSADSSDPNAMWLSWKNFREGVSFCYPTVQSGTNPSFMTIYDNRARLIQNLPSHDKTENDGQYYDPRYTIAEIGAQDTLNGQEVRVTVNIGSAFVGAPETCYTFIFDGSLQGKHFTLQELSHFQGNDFKVREITI